MGIVVAGLVIGGLALLVWGVAERKRKNTLQVA